MQRHLIVLAHSVEDSFTIRMTRAYLGELLRMGHDVRVHDLYRMGFNPVLSARELTEGSDVHVRVADALIAREDAAAAAKDLMRLRGFVRGHFASVPAA
ncbi:NAD(P)H-dependent oxidoreductase [Paraburkholderia oxyphila]|uniref:NAD(P)H-dependent oxidoreductase n=1 Tax=Paraburkholderia oxyphila TaxID=614212 RepID=UPI00048609E9|nr:NAD(P)H-dependent oxidoreductase [Paraburkholderia oxyphila]